jgi:hypothetical protein
MSTGGETTVEDLDRLTELTIIKNDFEDELRRQGAPLTPRQEREAPAATLKRIGQLNADLSLVVDERGEEVGRLLKAGHAGQELSGHLDRTDRYRFGPPGPGAQPEAGREAEAGQ